jgi:prepilin-type N-terminal cleavage/methylation domain-containing protein
MLAAMKAEPLSIRRVPSPRNGLTLIELIITLAIGLILLAIAVPQMYEMIARQRVAALAKELKNDVIFARTSTLERNEPMLISFNSNTDITCYIIYPEGNSSSRCNCARTNGPPCLARLMNGDPNFVQKLVTLKRTSGITITATGRHLQYTDLVNPPYVDTAAPRPVEATIQSSQGGTLKVLLTAPTKATICSVSGHTAEFGDCQ